MGQAFKVNEKFFNSREKAESHMKSNKIDPTGLEEVSLLDYQIVRKGRVVVLSSAVHHQRHAPCLVLVQVDKQNIPFRLTVTPVDNAFLPRRDVLPFDMFINLGGANPGSDADRAALVAAGYSLEDLYELFSDWFEKCSLGVSAIQEPRLFLPMYTTMAQYESMKELHIDEFFTHPIRVMESIMAFTNDVSWMQGKEVEFGKDSYTQFAVKCRHEIDRSDKGPLRLDKLARAYNYHLLTR